ncbi:GDP-mannose 4,6-dehydratase [Prolixibacter denitrificans]|uniref:Epimerase n=1 Tax=Prolixibacter denitrificans TaxID=1541063 RepID=A0A2P8CII4_9BACT|nr:GDP-mannose 4,6-dehydratase [Prolixibacter denitrificans]PSK84742.1 nucleoside-diphosphate-sugar epimerase [Prolixibacter denitrificans]GET20908.1 epimerase [Prolixibacter denitrificans]
MQTVLVTGCAGFIGSHLCESLLNKGFRVIGVDNFDPFYSRVIKERNLVSFIGQPYCSFAELDLANKDDLATFLKDKSPDIIVHLAGKAGVRPSIDDPAGYIRANITATQNILDIMKEKGIRKMAFASSSSVYGNCPETPFREDMDVSNPVSPYAFTKKSCELINYTYHHLYQLDILNMRFFTVFGPRQRPDLAIHKFTRLLRNNEPIPMFGDGGTARDYTYVADTVAGIESAIDYLLKNENVYETVNLGNNHPVLLRDMIQTIAEEAGVKPVINQLPMQDGDVNITYADISRAKELLGYQPKTSFREGIKKFLMWYDEMHSA